MRQLAFALFFAVAWAASVHAEDKLVVAQCGDGGCRCALSAITASEAGLVLGAAPPSDRASTLVEFDGEYIWSPLSLEEIDLAAGGDGLCPLELFDALVPEDGAWRGTVRNKSVLHCPAMLEPMLAGLSEQMVFARQIDWKGSFHPDKIRMEGSAPAIRWTKVGDNHFDGRGPSAAQKGVSSMVELTVTYDARLIDPRNVAIGVGVNILAKSVSQAVIDAAGLGKCRVRVDVDFRRDGN